jgi:hypothetical protein
MVKSARAAVFGGMPVQSRPAAPAFSQTSRLTLPSSSSARDGGDFAIVSAGRCRGTAHARWKDRSQVGLPCQDLFLNAKLHFTYLDMDWGRCQLCPRG